ncbi:SPOR domain-containing protein [Marinomonas pollencensis]|uniref:Sporulation related protein n=1 Tax=Marinomonas pollencensis TaxID=491954 RepID=A0A3E0DQA2_9GAMM|nr:SPOR domain-containing protein [Marinomonas pollencensis]REG84365.1 sporulation related protein [Marinomonas pollencensis]
MGIMKKLLLVSVALSLSACSVFEGKNTFMTYQDLQDKVKTHDTELQDMQAKLDRVDQLEAEVAELKKSQTGGTANNPAMNTADAANASTDGMPMPVANVAPAVTAAPAPVKPNYNNTQQNVATPVAVQSTQQSQDVRYGVQLAAYASQGEAARGWQVLRSASPDTYVNLVPHVNEKSVNGRTMYQLKVGPFLDRAYSVDFCNMLKQKGQDCLISRYDGQPL